jgi:hypothetical protein
LNVRDSRTDTKLDVSSHCVGSALLDKLNGVAANLLKKEIKGIREFIE